MRLRIFITMNLSCVGILFFFQCGGCDAVLQLRHQSTIGRPLQHHQVFSISYFPLFINLFHCVCLISVHVCLLVDLQTEVVLGVTWSLTRTCFELLRTLASKCHLVSDSMLGMNFQGSVRKYQGVDAKEIVYSGQLCQVHRTSKTFNWVHETGRAYQGQ